LACGCAWPRARVGVPPSWRRRVRPMGWGLLFLPIAWIALWLFGVNPATVGLLLLSGAVLIMAPGIAADLAAVLLILLGLYGLAAGVAVFNQGRAVAEVAKGVSVSVAPARAAAEPASARWAPAPTRPPVASGGFGSPGARGTPPAVPRPSTGPPKPIPVPGPPKSATLHQLYVEKITSLHQMAVPWSAP